jgi:hypothetical protein
MRYRRIEYAHTAPGTCSSVLSSGICTDCGERSLLRPASWNQTIPATERYLVLANFNQQAILDRETGLVWARSPFPGGRDVPWVTAITACLNFKLGNRWGWRLPTAPEFASLFDGSGDSVLPAGHPFQNVDPNSFYWTATTAVFISNSAYGVRPATDILQLVIAPKSASLRLWCVRGGSGVDVQ